MIRSPRRAFSARDCTRAGTLAAAIPISLAFTTYWLAPRGCDGNAWFCLLAVSLLGVAPFAALGLPVSFFVNRRRRHPLPDRWFPIMLVSGVVGQVIVAGISLWLVRAYVQRMFLFDRLIFPQGFVAGAIVGAVFWVSLVVSGPGWNDT